MTSDRQLEGRLLAAIWSGLWAANRLVRPISELIDAAGRVSEGDLTAQVKVDRDSDEIATLGLTFLLIVPLGLFFANFIILAGIQAKNTVEAGTSLMPGAMVVVFMGVFSTAPGIEKMAILPYLPVLNVSLAIRKLFSQQANPLEYVVALLMTIGLAVLMTWLSTRLLKRESAIFKV